MVHKCIRRLHHMNSPLHTCVSVHSRDMYTCGVTRGDNRKGHLKESRRLQNRTLHPCCYKKTFDHYHGLQKKAPMETMKAILVCAKVLAMDYKQNK